MNKNLKKLDNLITEILREKNLLQESDDKKKNKPKTKKQIKLDKTHKCDYNIYVYTLED